VVNILIIIKALAASARKSSAYIYNNSFIVNRRKHTLIYRLHGGYRKTLKYILLLNNTFKIHVVIYEIKNDKL